MTSIFLGLNVLNDVCFSSPAAHWTVTNFGKNVISLQNQTNFLAIRDGMTQIAHVVSKLAIGDSMMQVAHSGFSVQ